MGKAAGPATLTRPQGGAFGSSFSCEDCPKTNFNPPDRSDCPNFENRDGNPKCNRPDDEERAIEDRTIGTGFEDAANGTALAGPGTIKLMPDAVILISSESAELAVPAVTPDMNLVAGIVGAGGMN